MALPKITTDRIAEERRKVELVLTLKSQGKTLTEAVKEAGYNNATTYYTWLKRFGLENTPPSYAVEPAEPTEDDVPPDVDKAYPVGNVEALPPGEHAEKHSRVAAEYGKGMVRGLYGAAPQPSRMRIAQLAGELVTVQAAQGGQVRVRWAKEAGTDSGKLCDLSQLKDIAAELLEAHALMERGGAGGGGGNG